MNLVGLEMGVYKGEAFILLCRAYASMLDYMTWSILLTSSAVRWERFFSQECQSFKGAPQNL